MHEAEAFPPIRYPEECVLPIFARDGDEDMRCRLCMNLFLPLTFCTGMGTAGETAADCSATVVSRTTDSAEIWAMLSIEKNCQVEL